LAIRFASATPTA